MPTARSYFTESFAHSFIHALVLIKFSGQDVFFHLNHPVRWVRITGMVVAVDEFPARRIYTVDDSSGSCIECIVAVPKPDSKVSPSTEEQPAAAADTPHVPDEVDVGTVVDIKGGLGLFRGNKQIRIEKATVVRSTGQEVAYWEKVEAFRREVLDRPWRLTDKMVRRCRKEAERNG